MPMNSNSLRMAIFAAALTGAQACSATEHIVCPSAIRLDKATVAVDAVPAGFQPMVSKSATGITGVSAYDGPAEEGAALKPTSEGAKDGSAEWHFAGSFPRGKWISCDYAKGLLRLTRRVEDGTSVCSASIRKMPPYGKLEASFSCR
jgi:hypothetical protein